jgi:hypothetical protein
MRNCGHVPVSGRVLKWERGGAAARDELNVLRTEFGFARFFIAKNVAFFHFQKYHQFDNGDSGDKW